MHSISHPPTIEYWPSNQPYDPSPQIYTRQTWLTPCQSHHDRRPALLRPPIVIGHQFGYGISTRISHAHNTCHWIDCPDPTISNPEATRRNIRRFPADFMLRLTRDEAANLRSQIATSNKAGLTLALPGQHGGRRYQPWAFTEQGVAMLSSVLHSQRAVDVNIAIMRAFVRLRRVLADHAELAHRIDELERKYDGQFAAVFDALRKLIAPPEPERKVIGFHTRELPAIPRSRRSPAHRT